MDNAKTLNNYKSDLEACSADLRKLVDIIPQQKLESLKVESDLYQITPCYIWNIIQYILVGGNLQSAALVKEVDEIFDYSSDRGILGFLSRVLEELIESGLIENCSLKEELERALKLNRCLADAIRQVNCNDRHESLVGELFCVLLQLILLILAIIAKIIILIIFCNRSCCNLGGVSSSFCKCLTCDLSKELDQVEKLIDELREIAIEFIIRTGDKCKSDKKHDDKCDHHDKCDCHDKCDHHDKCDCHDECDRDKERDHHKPLYGYENNSYNDSYGSQKSDREIKMKYSGNNYYNKYHNYYKSRQR
ncbi:hypothetical protein [Metaclostridioides mangenotii]|uniref:hypothetical protein n=1 Tax=Metaclostridioides mangenotii TaxID=1540 RepID=UPI00046424EA|nr:hypothetical protein [Clostridioides mangenotii]